MAAPSCAGVEPLSWDSDFLGFAVGRVVSAAPALALLREAFAAGYELLYCPGERPDTGESGYSIGYSDRRITYALDLSSAPTAAAAQVAAGIAIAELSAGPAPAALLALAPVAGAHSRFQRDPRIPDAKFIELYQTWLARSAMRELADTVCVASDVSGPIGFATGSVSSQTGDIGLVAVSDLRRGDGVGLALIVSLEHWMQERGATLVEVVTQEENLAACRLYEKAGFAVQSRMTIHHLWREGDSR